MNDKIDILCISEHWICQNNVKNLCFQNHKIISYFSRLNHIHGGSLIMISNKMKSNDVDSIKRLSVEYHIEMCAAITTINEKNIYCSCCL